MKIKEILKFLDEKYPKFIAEDWDNVGFLIGNREEELNAVLLALDLTENVIDEAIAKGVNLIITHHPLIFKPMKSITSDNILGRKILKLIQNKISVYSLHTNIDLIKNGLNDYIGKLIFPAEDDVKILIDEKKELEFGLGRLYNLKSRISVGQLIESLKRTLSIKKMSFIGEDKEMMLKKIAIINGAGSSYWRKAKEKGADILITGDVKYHEALEAKEERFVILDIGHYESEIGFIELLESMLKEQFKIRVEKIREKGIFEIV